MILIILLFVFFIIGKVSIENEKKKKEMEEKRQESQKGKIIKYSEKLHKNEKLNKVINNFIKKYKPEIFTSSFHLIAFERFLSELDSGSKILWSNDLIKLDDDSISPNSSRGYTIGSCYLEPMWKFESEIIKYSRDTEILIKAKGFFQNEFQNLLRLIERYQKFETKEIAIGTLWVLLRESAIDYYSELFGMKYERGKFENISKLNQKQCIDIFFKYIREQEQETLMFTCFLIKRRKIKINNLLVADLIKVGRPLYSKIRTLELKKDSLKDFEASLLNYDSDIATSNFTIHDVDVMDGMEFEQFINSLFKKMGYESEVTKATGDQGIDIIAKKNGKSLGIQAKCYSNVVSNKAVQEVVAGVNYYNLDQGIVITNNKFTKSAEELAIANNILLWDREILKDKIAAFMKG